MNHIVAIVAVGAVALFAAGMALVSMFEDKRMERPHTRRPPPRGRRPSPPPSPPSWSPPVRRRRRSPSPPPCNQASSPPSRQPLHAPSTSCQSPPSQQPISPPPRQQSPIPTPTQQSPIRPPSQQSPIRPPSQQSPSPTPNQSQRESPPPNVIDHQIFNENRSPDSESTGTSNDRNPNYRPFDCRVCGKDEVDQLMTFIPCRCSFMCNECSRGYLKRYDHCPLCNERVNVNETVAAF